MWPDLLAYVLSFFVIGIMWQNHHAIFRLVRRVDRLTVACNLVLLLFTVLIPVATQALGAYGTTHAATFLYGVVLTCCSTAYNAMFVHLYRAKAFDPSVADATLSSGPSSPSRSISPSRSTTSGPAASTATSRTRTPNGRSGDPGRRGGWRGRGA